MKMTSAFMKMTSALVILFRPLLKHKIRYAEIMNINLIPYIGHLVRSGIDECKSNKQKTTY